MSAKHKEVLKWLETVYGENQIPYFEKNSANVEVLYNIMVSYNESAQDFENVSSFNAEAHPKLNKYIQEKQKILQTLDFTNSLSPQEKKILDTISNLCKELDLESPSSANINHGIHVLEEQDDEVNALLAKEKYRTKKLLKLSKNTGKNLEELKNISVQAENTAQLKEKEVKAEEARSKFCKQKMEQYGSEVHLLENKLAHVGYESYLSHNVLANKMNELRELEKQYENSKNTLESYTLPPDMSLALIEVEKARQKLGTHMQQIAQKYEEPF